VSAYDYSLRQLSQQSETVVSDCQSETTCELIQPMAAMQNKPSIYVSVL